MKGFAFIEILVALLIISLGLLGIVGMQLSALRNSEAAYQQSIAINQLAAMSDRLRANHGAAARDRELARWNVINARLLPKGRGSYHCVGNACKALLEWEFGKRNQETLSLEIGEY